MHRDQPVFSGKPILPPGDKVGCYMQNAPMPYVFNGLVPPAIKPLRPFRNVDIHPSDTCPKNFIILDQTNNRSRIMFHPEISSKILHPGSGVGTYLFQDNVDQKDGSDERKTSSPLKEYSDDVDALLSTEYEETEESDDEVSTARTNAIYGCSSPDSCSNHETVSRKSWSFCRKSSGRRGNDKKRQRMRKMVKTLRGIVPGANQMSTVAVLDEAVRYLKSIRVEVQKMGVGKSKD